MMKTSLTIVGGVALVAVFWWQGERFIAANGPTFDEAAHLAAGYTYWTTGDFTMNREDPPLLKLWWAAPLALDLRPEYPWGVAKQTNYNHWFVGNALLHDSGMPVSHLLTPARRMNLAVGCGVVLLAGWWAYRAWKCRLAALAATAFAAFDPNLLAFSCLLSTDAGLAFFALLSSYLVWEYAGNPSRPLLVGLGASLGLMLGAKLSALGVIAGLGASGSVFILGGGVLALPGVAAPAAGWTAGSRLRAAIDLAFRLGIIAVLVLAATYGFVHFPQWGAGLQFQLTRKSFGNDVYYLCGELSESGWYHYFLAVLALKVPLGLSAAGLGGLLGRGRPELRSVFLLLTPLVFIAAASYSRVDFGIRVILPAIPFLYVVAARLAMPGCCRAVRLALLAGCVAWVAVAGWTAAPHQIAYFNELAGGPRNGIRYLADSNLDWGQGLPQLKEYMQRERIGIVYLSFFGTDRPESYGIRYHPLKGYGPLGKGEEILDGESRHVLAISANSLLGLFLDDPESYAWLRERQPTAVLGGSIYVFDLTGDPAAVHRVRTLSAR